MHETTVDVSQSCSNFFLFCCRQDLSLYYPVLLISNIAIYNVKGYKPRNEFLMSLGPLAFAGKPNS